MKLTVVDIEFPKFSFLLENLNFIIPKQTLSVCFSLRWWAHLVHFQKTAIYPTLKNHGYYQFFFQVKLVFLKKKRLAMSAPNLNNSTIASHCTSSYFCMLQKCFICFSSFLIQNIKRKYTWGLTFSKNNYL